MAELAPHIPTETYVGLLGRTVEVHWNYHAILMVFIWAGLVPLCIFIMRFHKPPPSEKGIQKDVRLMNREWWFFSVHKYGLIFAMSLAIAGAAVAMIVSGGISGSVHAYFGAMTVVMGIGQLISSQFRGTRGGKYREGSDPDDPATWRGDQYDHTPKRRRFEAYHKTCGYFTIFCAFGAIGSGLMQYNMPVLFAVFILCILAIAAAWIVYEFQERSYDGYRVAHGYGLEHPYNAQRKNL